MNWKIRYITDYLENGPVGIPDGIVRTHKEEEDIQKEEVYLTHQREKLNLKNITDKKANRIISEYLKERKE